MMQMEKQVTNLELSKKLRELEVPQESLFNWNIWDNELPIIQGKGNFGGMAKDMSPYLISAFTCSELGELLPDYTECHKWEDSLNPKHPDRWMCRNENYAPGHNTADNSQVNAQAKMLIWLLEQGILKPERLTP